MAYQAVFKRYELKYLLTPQQKAAVLEAMRHHIAPDQYGRTTIRNLYYDTDNYLLIRRSIDKPLYKEKLRFRSYRRCGKEDKVFVELKKKHDGIVYKRRLSMPQQAAMDWLAGNIPCPAQGQIPQEIDYARTHYGTLHPVIYLTYEREAYYSLNVSDFRVTFDDNIRCSFDIHSLEAESGEIPILEEDRVLMEIKCSGGIPIWMTEILSSQKIYKTSFSKYGTAYCKLIFPNIKGGLLHA